MIFLLCVASLFVVVATETCSDPSDRIRTEPVLLNNTLARNFQGLKLSIKLFGKSDLYSWSHPGFTPRRTTIYQPNEHPPCVNKSENGFHVTCQLVSGPGSINIISTMTLMFPLDKNVTFTACQGEACSIKLACIDIKVGGCSIGRGRQLEVVAQSNRHNVVGEFRCRNNGVLFYSNETRLVSNKTKCLPDGRWKNSEVVQCWTGPSKVSIVGNFNVTEGGNITVRCEFQSGFPASTKSLFIFNGTETSVEGRSYTFINVQKANHNQSISCQVQSPYVEHVNQSSSRSQQRFINVWYPPYATSPQQCTWKVNTTGVCNVSFQSNPEAEFRSVLFDGLDINHSVEASNFVGLPSNQQFIFIRENVNKTFAGSYELILFSTRFNETKITFEINVIDQSSTTQSPFTTQPTYMARDQAVVVACAVLGALVAVATAILLVKIYLKKKEIDGPQLEVENVIYDAAPDRGHSVVPDTYLASDNTQTEAAYGVVDTTKKKKQKISDISTANNTNMPTDSIKIDAAYGEVDKTKKIQKKKTSDKPVAFYTIIENDEAYGLVDKTKKKQKKEITGNRFAPQPDGVQIDDTYAEVNKIKKTKKKD